jgi:hypothetical protein
MMKLKKNSILQIILNKTNRIKKRRSNLTNKKVEKERNWKKINFINYFK